MWNASYGYFEQKVDPAHPEKMNSNRGCCIDRMYGQVYAARLGLPRSSRQTAKVALGNVFRNNFLPDSSSYSRVSGIPGGAVYSIAGEAGTVMCSWKFGGADQAGSEGALIYFNEVWSGQEYQLVAHLFSDGLTTEGLAVTKAVHDRSSCGTGNLTLRTFSQQITGTPTSVTATVAGTNRPATLAVTGDRAVVTLTSPVVVTTGQTVGVTIR